MKSYISGKRILVSGGNGFLGRHIVEKLKVRRCAEIFVPDVPEYDLRKLDSIRKAYDTARPDIIIHLAAKVGGIGLNKARPGELFYDNLIMGTQMMEEARLREAEKFVALGTICCYPKFTPVPFKEKDLWNGYPEETNAPYGLAKKMLLVQAQSYRAQYGFNAIFLMPVNLYGPGDNFDPGSSHVIPAIIKKCFDAIESGEKKIVIWGSGNPTREFLYVEDCAEAIVLATEKYNSPEPVNIGAGFEIKIRNLVGLIANMADFKGKIEWDKSRPDGQPRRHLDVTRAKKEFGFKAKVSFERGLKETVEWYKNYRKKGGVL
ncbi:MAG: GDP-L-fucose synthase [Candidatus Omnitrophica bacterium]|nr:GDP-L-fucose synthase [Candidatus Omnitrophota bacterium]